MTEFLLKIPACHDLRFLLYVLTLLTTFNISLYFNTSKDSTAIAMEKLTTSELIGTMPLIFFFFFFETGFVLFKAVQPLLDLWPKRKYTDKKKKKKMACLIHLNLK